MGFSTKEMHIAFFDHLTPKAFNEAFDPISEGSLSKLISAVDRAIDLGETGDVVLMVTFSGENFLHNEQLASLMSFIETHSAVKRIASTMTETITLVTADGFVVTIRLIGCKKFNDISTPPKANAKAEADDSFESVEDLTQKVLEIQRATPRRY
jgi:hypothetical protein